MMAGIEWSGVNELQARLLQAHAKALMELGGALYLEGETIMELSKRRVPVDLGALKGSGFVETPEYSGHKAEVTLGYGGPAGYREAVKSGVPGELAAKVPGYALLQHERTDYHHRGQGEPFYLATAVDDFRPGVGQRIARRIKRRRDTIL